MKVEGLTSIPLKMIQALSEFDDPKSFCAALAFDGILDGKLSYGDWRRICEEGISLVGGLRIVRQVAIPLLGFEEGVGYCRSDQIEDGEVFVDRVVRSMVSERGKILVNTFGEDIPGHALSFVTYAAGISAEYNALRNGYIGPASERRMREVLADSLTMIPSYYYSFGFKMNPRLNDNADLSEYCIRA